MYIIHCTLYIDQFPVGEGGQTEWCICCSFPPALAGGTVGRLSLLLRVARVALRTALAGNPCTIPFCRKRMALDREGNCHRQGRRWLVRTGWQNGIPYPPGRVLTGGVPFSLCSELAGLWCTVTSCPYESEVPFGRSRRRFNVSDVGVGNAGCFGRGGDGQTEWCICCSFPLALAGA